MPKGRKKKQIVDEQPKQNIKVLDTSNANAPGLFGGVWHNEKRLCDMCHDKKEDVHGYWFQDEYEYKGLCPDCALKLGIDHWNKEENRAPDDYWQRKAGWIQDDSSKPQRKKRVKYLYKDKEYSVAALSKMLNLNYNGLKKYLEKGYSTTDAIKYVKTDKKYKDK